MVTFITSLHIGISIFLIIIVLLQHGKGADVGATFGGASQTVLGARGAATFLSKVTVGTAITFMLTSISLAYLSSHESSKSVFKEGEKTQIEKTVPKEKTDPIKPVSSEKTKSKEKAEPKETNPAQKP